MLPPYIGVILVLPCMFDWPAMTKTGTMLEVSITSSSLEAGATLGVGLATQAAKPNKEVAAKNKKLRFFIYDSSDTFLL